MSDLKAYTQVFVDEFDIEPQEAPSAKLNDPAMWDSFGHAGLIMALEETFNIMISPEDVVEIDSFEKGREILGRYGLDLS